MSDESQPPSPTPGGSPILANPSFGSYVDLSTHRQNKGKREDSFRPAPPCDNFGVAIVCALAIEAAAVLELFEERWDNAGLDRAPADTNSYSFGSIGSHTVVLAHMHSMGKVAAATVAGNLRASFRHLKLVLVVGICGGAPNAPNKPCDDVFLGDVVVSTGVIQYDFGRRFPGGFVRKDTPRHNLSRLSVVADGVLAKLKAAEAGRGREFSRSVSRHLDALQQQLGPDAAYPGREGDRLFQPDYLHKHHELSACLVCTGNAGAVCDDVTEKSCETLGCSQQVSNLVARSPPGHRSQPTVHFGLVASGDTVMRSGRDRDEIARRDGVIAFEMEGAGCWEILRECSCLIIKSVCDYADSHKNKMFQGYAAVVAAATAKALLESWDTPIQLLGRLETVPYMDRKDRNPRRVPGTCEWFVGHELFRNWLRGSQQKDCYQTLWVSADPGCVLPSTQYRTTCYFFFKDDFEDQKTTVNAICCILHQLFTQKPVLFSDAVRTRLKAEGDKLIRSFRALWELLLGVAREEDAGEIICVLDALDECAADDRQILSEALLDQHRTKKATNLKFLLTSRPFGSIRRGFQPPDMAELAVVHLSGESEEEMKQISKEIDIFIEARVQGVAAKLNLDKDEQDMLLRGLLNVPNRTYLWVYLTLDHVERSENISKRKIREAPSQLPKSVDEAYEKILSTSCAPGEARKILHIIVGVERPLTVREMNFALTIRPSHQSYQDVELDSDERFRERLRNICGLFVTVIDSRIYLLHQTAREFLVKADPRRRFSPDSKKRKPQFRWKYSLDPAESHRVLAEICLWNLRLPEILEGTPEIMAKVEPFQDHPELEFDVHRIYARYGQELLAQLRSFMRGYGLLEYSAYFWATHLRALHVGVDKELTQAMVEICDACHQHRPWWFRCQAREHEVRNREFPLYLPLCIADDPATTPLMIASYFGLVPAVQAFLKTKRGQLHAKDTRDKTALVWAAAYCHADVAKVLVDGEARTLWGLEWLRTRKRIIEEADHEQKTPLMWAVEVGSVSVVRLLLDHGANIEARNGNGETPLIRACTWENSDVCRLIRGCSWESLDVLRLLLERGAQVEARSKDRYGRGATPLTAASQFKPADAVRLLIQFGANVNAREPDGMTPLLFALARGREENAKLLLENKADIGLKSMHGDTALALACREGMLDIVKLLLKRGVDINDKSAAGISALSHACQRGREAIVRFLVEKGADIGSRCDEGWTPLRYRMERCNKASKFISIGKFLLDNGADIEARDSHGTSTLAAVARRGNYHAVRWLLENGADPESQNEYGETPLVQAAIAGSDRSVSALLQAGANVNVTAQDGKSALHLVIAYNQEASLVKQLLDRGVDIEYRDKEGRTALSHAAGREGLSAETIVAMLLEKGADIHSKDDQGRTPFVWANANPVGTGIANLLVKHGADIIDVDDVDTMAALSLARSEREKQRWYRLPLDASDSSDSF
ncbi:ankyrin repeat-containing domain protein [Chaetomium fimeti]|uniref:Ankyrin repeat-containing domain protein n=1 Tax=Chaetomium fimeti TaxID=1854472 RepID=A0AAE0H9D4_9PEZI|nr:ankyrin repeat-containing domain protein [Chaetomium fimeti]